MLGLSGIGFWPGWVYKGRGALGGLGWCMGRTWASFLDLARWGAASPVGWSRVYRWPVIPMFGEDQNIVSSSSSSSSSPRISTPHYILSSTPISHTSLSLVTTTTLYNNNNVFPSSSVCLRPQPSWRPDAPPSGRANRSRGPLLLHPAAHCQPIAIFAIHPLILANPQRRERPINRVMISPPHSATNGEQRRMKSKMTQRGERARARVRGSLGLQSWARTSQNQKAGGRMLRQASSNGQETTRVKIPANTDVILTHPNLLSTSIRRAIILRHLIAI